MADDPANEESKPKPIGPITAHQDAQRYLDEAKIPQLFRSLVAGLMVERPADPLTYMDTKLEELQVRGLDNIDWETFVYDHHPSRENPRAQLVHEEKVPEVKKGIPPFADDDYEPQLFQLTEPKD